MDVSLSISAAVEQATVSPRIFRIVLYQFAVLDNLPTSLVVIILSGRPICRTA